MLIKEINMLTAYNSLIYKLELATGVDVRLLLYFVPLVPLYSAKPQSQNSHLLLTADPLRTLITQLVLPVAYSLALVLRWEISRSLLLLVRGQGVALSVLSLLMISMP